MTGCNEKAQETNTITNGTHKIQIGLAFDSYVIERWQRDRDVFVSTAKEMDAVVNVQNANGDVKEQIEQIEYFIEKEMDVIVIIPVDSKACKEVVKKAKDKGIYVIAYDRLIEDANVDLYISFDNEEVGRMMAKTLIEHVPESGNIVTIFGPQSDYNVSMMEKGYREMMEESTLNNVYSVYAKDWLAEEAFYAVNHALTLEENIHGVLCGNDNLATQAVMALSENRMASKVVLTGQDGDLAAFQRIVEGTQTMTVYKPVDKLAKKAAEFAVNLVRGEQIAIEAEINDGTYDIPYFKLEPIRITIDNIDDVIIAGGVRNVEEVYLNVNESSNKE